MYGLFAKLPVFLLGSKMEEVVNYDNALIIKSCRHVIFLQTAWTSRRRVSPSAISLARSVMWWSE